ncbi:HINT domain-containing protein [Micromonospora sp. NBC_00389]|uniref:polymorphic toxin-type HINT domain-containing protein n=1 Tax=Micromonospora sp. NBC_00389 TaxID=2903586 RepID=UPI002E24E239
MMFPTGAVLFDLPSFDTWMIIERPRLSSYRDDQERLHSNGQTGHIATLPEPCTSRPIGDIAEGDKVLAHDPQTGETSAQTVEKLHNNVDQALTDLTVRTADGNFSTLKTTQHHPFWSVSRSDWVDAKDLRPEEWLKSTSGDPVIVVKVHSFVGLQAMHDLTVSKVHTYYVITGDAPVLVHNCDTSLTQAQADTLRVGPHADVSIPATGPTVTTSQGAAMQGLPCHTCGAVNPNVTMVGDHQPPSGLSPIGGQQRLFPQCPGTCSAGQATAVQRGQQILRNHGIYNPNAPGAYERLLELLPGHTRG